MIHQVIMWGDEKELVSKSILGKETGVTQAPCEKNLEVWNTRIQKGCNIAASTCKTMQPYAIIQNSRKMRGKYVRPIRYSRLADR
jgi:hypothetical protein